MKCGEKLGQNKVLFKDSGSDGLEFTAGGKTLRLSVKVVDTPGSVIEQWKWLESFATDPFSNYAWVNAWYEAHKHAQNCAPAIILGTDQDQKPLFLLPLFWQKIGPFNVLLRPGRTHSAYFSGLFSPRCREMINAGNAGQFWKLVLAVVPWADVLAIDGVPEEEITQNNPLGFLPLLVSKNPSYEMQLGPDWEKFYKEKVSSQTRRNNRRCEKRLCEHGELRFSVVENQDERLALLRVLLAQKAEQFKQRGIVNPYEMETIALFYQTLVQSENGPDAQTIIINAIFLDDIPLAANLGMILKGRYHGLIMSMTTGTFERFSPGRILLFATLQYLSGKGIRKLDFGVGQAVYKKSLMDTRINRYHVLAPLSVKGRLFAYVLGRAAALKALIKSSDRATQIVNRLRWYSKKD